VGFVVGLGLLFMVPGMLVAIVVEWGSSTSDSEVALGLGALTTLAAGALLVTFTRLDPDMPPASVFAAVAWTWIGSSLFGALPLWFSGELGSFDNALFESVSGYTATGSTVLSPIEGVGRGVLMWRQIIQWYGGMGMVVLAVTILPFLGVGGLSLISAEAPGPTSDRLAPRVSSTARRLWALYGGITAAVAGALMGMDPYDQPDIDATKTRARELGKAPGPAAIPAATEAERAAFFRRDLGAGLVWNAYVGRDPANEAALEAARGELGERLGVPTALAWGPGLLHSFGQLQKGGPPNLGVLLVTWGLGEDIRTPAGRGLGELMHLLALADYQVLRELGRPVCWLHDPRPGPEGREAVLQQVGGWI